MHWTPRREAFRALLETETCIHPGSVFDPISARITVGSTRVLSIDEGVGKMKAALAGRQDPALVIAGRTSAAAITGLDDAIARGRAYQAAGVDAMFFTGVSSREDVEAVASALDIPIFMGGSGAGVLGDRDFLARNNVRYWGITRSWPPCRRPTTR